MLDNAGNEKGGRAKMLMGPEKAVSLGRKAGEGSWKDVIGWKRGLKDAACTPICRCQSVSVYVA